MKNKQMLIIAAGIVVMSTLTSCKKDECHECHYDDANGIEVELGEKCNEELHQLEENGYELNGAVYTVHCHEH